MKDKALRYNTGKLDMSILDYKSLEPLIKVMEAGAVKYERNNWKKSGFTKESIINSGLRHITALSDAIANGTSEYDDDTTVHHIGGVFAFCMFYTKHFVENSTDPEQDWETTLKNLKIKYDS